MKRMPILCGLLLALLLFGCQKTEEPAPAQTAPAPQQQAPTLTEAVKEDIATVVEEAQEIKEAVAEDVAEIAQKAKEEIAVVVEKGEQALSEVSDAAEETAVAAKEQIVAAADSAKAAVDETVAKLTPTTSPETIVFTATMGNVTMPHLVHADAFSCATCHGDGVPGALDLGREAAHALCIGCHQEQKAGPTGCRDCHVK